MPADSESDDFLNRTLADIIGEVKRLRDDKISLTAANNALRRKNSAQRLLPDLYAAQLAETKALLRTVVWQCGLQLPLLPPEILLAIFRLTQPQGPPYHHPPSLYRGPRNPWLDSLKTKKALVLVCKAWSAPATELLYSDIVLRRMGQVSALANAFRSDRKQSLASLVRAIHFDMFVVLTHCAKVVREDFEYILAQCTMLRSFVYIPHPNFDVKPHSFAIGDVPTGPAAFSPTWILDLRTGRAGRLLARSLGTRLLTLHLDLTAYEGSFLPLANLLSSAPCLTSVELGSMTLQSDDVPPALPDLSFPALRTLSLYCDVPQFVHYVTTQWTMLRLATLTCVASDHIPIAFLEAHGTQLEYLHFMYTDEPHNLHANTVLLPRLHELCPRIEHLVLLIVPSDRTALDIHSPSLRYLDICGRPTVAGYRAIALAPTARAPRLAKVRLVLDMFAFVPRYFHPAHMPGTAGALEDVERLPGMEVSDERANWLMSTAGGVVADFAEWRIRQQAWGIAIDELSAGTFPLGAVGDPRVADEDMTDSEGEYEYESVPTSPAESESDVPEEDASGGDGGCSDEEFGRAWILLREAAPPIPSMVTFTDDLLDSARRQYDRETILEGFSRSQLGDFLLD